MSGTSEVTIGKSVHSCKCGESTDEIPVIDARLLPHEIRHAAIFGALDSLSKNGSLDIIAPHDPLPLIKQAKNRYGQIGVEYLEIGPDVWRLRFTR